ncbi:MAG: outer membrane protein [Thermoanaerobaculia bacterium]|jgi:outer membrane protein TolC|nr:outer membrane protein [Thermoanaerobaculia bacterium]
MLPKRLSLLLFALTVSAAAQTPAQPLHLTLDDAIHMALGSGTQAELARSNEQLARIARSEALNALFPQADAKLMRYNQSINLQTFGFSLPGLPPVVGPFNVTDAQLSAAVQVFNFAALRRYQSLKSSAEASRYQNQQAENDVAAAVARLYLIARRAQTQIDARQADVTLFTRLLQTSQDEFKAGTGTRLDTAQANVQLARARQALLLAQNDRQIATLALLNAIGADESGDVVFTALPTAPTSVPALDPSLAAAKENRPELRQAIEQVRAARLTVEAARARLLPSVSLDFEGDMSGNRSNDLHWSRRIAANLGVPLFRADINANIARAKVMLHDAETQLTQRQRDVEQDVRRSLMTLQNAESRVTVATESATVAEEALTVARDRRAAGYGSPVEVDRAQDAYRQAHEDLIAAEADAAAAQFDYEHATGGIRHYITGSRTNAAEAKP